MKENENNENTEPGTQVPPAGFVSRVAGGAYNATAAIAVGTMNVTAKIGGGALSATSYVAGGALNATSNILRSASKPKENQGKKNQKNN